MINIIYNDFNEKIETLENFNDVDEAAKVNVLLHEDGFIKYYATLNDGILSIYGHPTQNEISTIYYLLNKDGHVGIKIELLDAKLEQNNDINIIKFLDIDTLKSLLIERVKIKFNIESQRPRVDCTNIKDGMFLDGGRNDILNFEAYRDLLVASNTSSGTIKTADNTFVELSIDELNTSIIQLKQAALQSFQNKWTLEANIINSTTVDDLLSIQI